MKADTPNQPPTGDLEVDRTGAAAARHPPDEPSAALVGRRFYFAGGGILLQVVCTENEPGTVLSVEPAANAGGRRGHVVYFSTSREPRLRVAWSLFRDHARLLEVTP